MRTILVTGGAGFIGSHTVVELLAAEYRPVIVDNFSRSKKSVIKRLEKLTGQALKYYAVNYQDSKKMESIIRNEKVDGIVHFAAYKAVDEPISEPLKYYENNVAGFVRLLQIATLCQVDRFLLSSSAAVYGEPPEPMVTEDTACRPASPYGWSKYVDEIILRDTCSAISDFSGIALRYFNVVGAHSSALIGEQYPGKPQNLLPAIMQAAENMGQLRIFGTDYPTPDGSCLRDYIHVVDLAKAHVAALDRMFSKKISYETYNVGTGKPTSVLELIKTFETVNGVPVPYEVSDRRPGDSAACFASAKKAEKELGWKSTKTTEDAVRDAWSWRKSLAAR